MIVQPDILSHWKVRSLCLALGTGEALTALLGLWAHCQNSRAWIFRLTPLMLGGICHYTGDPNQLLRVMVECKFLDPLEDGSYEVHDWAEKNGALVRNWGAWDTHRAKQPLKTTPKSPLKTSEGEAEEAPKNVLRGVDKIREDKIREESSSAESQGELPGLPSPPADHHSTVKPPRQSDECFGALCALTGSSLTALTKSERGRLNAALKEIRTACPGLTPAELRARAASYQELYRNAPLTAPALAANWSRLAASQAAGEPKKNLGGPPPVLPAPAWDWRGIHEDLYDQAPADDWHQLQPYVREAIEKHYHLLNSDAA